MRSFLVLILASISFAGISQEKNSLLWEISGNGLAQSSYLYGTMHVSKRIAFRLDDVFYEALDESEVIALESDPATWLEDQDALGYSGYGQANGFITKGFYTLPFAVRNPKKEELAAYIAFEDRRINSILYRSNEYSQDFEEETYLDMFIYQAGKKFGKKVVALEDLEESSALVGRASMNAVKPKPDEWLQKKMQEQDPLTLLQDAYRNRDIDMLDSIDRAMYTDHYLKNMLFIRNHNMAVKLDSVMRTAKVFSGIGAAHLPGKKGVIAMLRDMGYTVKPLLSKSTPQGNLLKEKIESTLVNHTYHNVQPDDGLFSIALPNKLYPIAEYTNTTYISPDLANGSYVMLNRIPTFSYLKQDEVFTLEAIDKLLFENIPGKIMEKSWINRDGFKGLDVKNQLKNGDHQRYHIFITPLEILIFKMGGEGDYVMMYSDTIFNSIRFKQLEKRFVPITSDFSDFEIKMPSLHSFTNRVRQGDRLAQGYDSISGSYYFLRKATLNDLNFIEEDSFELKQIQKRFYQDLELKPDYDEVRKNTLSSKAIIDSTLGTYLHLKSVFKGNEYYLLGIVTNNDTYATNYFESFKIKPPEYTEKFETVTDTALFFTTVTSVKPVKFVENSSNYYSGEGKPKAYSAFNKKTIYQNKNNEAISVELNKSHDFLMFANIDSVWALRKKIYADKRFIIFNEKQRMITEDLYELDLTLTDTASTRGILIKNIVKGGLLYELKASVDTVHKPSGFISEFYANFMPTDTLIGKSILQDKTAAFFTALRTNDSIVKEGYPFIKFQKQHIDSLKYYISEFEYPDDKKEIQSHLIQKLAQLDDPEVMPFFKNFYMKSYNNSSAQSLILSTISKNADEKSVQLLLELMAKDLPLVSNSFDIHNIFKPFKDSLPLAKLLYPEILDYSAIEEYKLPIFSMLANLKAKGLVKPKTYKKYRKQILNDAKIQLKRQLGKVSQKQEQGGYFNASATSLNGTIDVLEDYAILLYPFIAEKEVRLFFDRLSLIQDPKIGTTYATLLANDTQPLPIGLLNSLAADISSRVLLFNKLKATGKLNLFPEKYRNARSLAESLLFDSQHFNTKKDSLLFIAEKPLVYKGKALTGYYFKTRNKSDYDKNFKMHLIVFENSKILTTKPFYKSEELRIEDTDTDEEAMEYVTETFLLKDRQRAMVFRPNGFGGQGFYGY
ncbi:MAG: TraB/GumN family protein [Flavobacteriaceae bacterium]